MARTNLHELANRLLTTLIDQSTDGVFEGKLRSLSADAGLNSVRSAEAIKLLEEVDRIDVVQRGRRGRDTIIKILSSEPIRLEDAEARLPRKATKRAAARLSYDDIGKAVIDRLLEVSKDDGLRAAQVEAFAAESGQLRSQVIELEQALENSASRETDLRIRLKTAEEALERAEENMRKVFGQQRPDAEAPGQMDDDEARAVLDILRSGRT
jgi:hypothetical protein